MPALAAIALLILSAPDERVTGGVFAPAALSSGTNALYGFVGAPEVGVGYRQGFGLIEFEARAAFNVFETSAGAEVGAKIPVLTDGKLQLAPLAMLGVKFNSGLRYFDTANFAYVGLRPKVGLNASYVLSETIAGFAQLEVPLAIGLSTQGFQFTPLIGAGAEFHLGNGISLSVSAHVGMDATREPLGVTQFRPAAAGRIGVGYRIF